MRKRFVLMWIAYCPECRKAVDESPNGNVIQHVAEDHSKETGHKTLVGFWARTEDVEEEATNDVPTGEQHPK